MDNRKYEYITRQMAVQAFVVATQNSESGCFVVDFEELTEPIKDILDEEIKDYLIETELEDVIIELCSCFGLVINADDTYYDESSKGIDVNLFLDYCLQYHLVANNEEDYDFEKEE